MNDERQNETEVLSRAQGETWASGHRHAEDPLKDIPPSLLSADDIERYVRATGLIAPFFTGGGRKKRLKKAAYEGRIGSIAYAYDETERLEKLDLSTGNLVVPANAIVLVESDLDFRLPPYIALRYNLQIRHVHRGLLLGTGPLVDPGYWGKLCIPLHNLTSEDYVIPISEGLIWIEFTKTTSNPKTGRDALEPHSEHWDIKKFIIKAATPLNDAPMVPIRSSISAALLDAKKAAAEANQAKKEAADARRTVQTLGFGAAVIVFIAIMTLWASFFTAMTDYYSTLDARIDAFSTQLQAGIGRRAETPETVLPSIEALEAELRSLRIENERLRQSPDAEPDPAAADGTVAE